MADDESLPKLDAEAIRQQAAAMAAHLQRVGIQWLPLSQPLSVASWREQMADAFTTDLAESTRAPTHAPTRAPAEAAPSVRADRPAPSSPQPSIGPTTLPLPVPPVDGSRDPYPGAAMSLDQRQAALQQLGMEVAACTRCEVLSSCRKQTVFGEGAAKPRFVFFGEAPGAEEDRSGRPFVGPAGQLLTKMIEACKLKRDEVYILNTVKCRPPDNRNPEPDELANCRPYYQSQLQILRPEYIVCLGAVSAQELLQNRASVGRLRGNLHRYHDSKVLVTYHPSYLLRNPAAKKAAWQDLQLMLRDAGIDIKGN
jgi:uracil-DNA glycosylase family 4